MNHESTSNQHFDYKGVKLSDTGLRVISAHAQKAGKWGAPQLGCITNIMSPVNGKYFYGNYDDCTISRADACEYVWSAMEQAKQETV